MSGDGDEKEVHDCVLYQVKTEGSGKAALATNAIEEVRLLLWERRRLVKKYRSWGW